MKKQKIGTYALLHIILLIYSLGGIVSKLAANEDVFSLKFIFLYGILLIMLAIYAIGWQQVIKKIPLTTAYANKAITVVWSMLCGIIFFDEELTIKQIIGALLVVIGVVVFALTDKESGGVNGND